MKPMEVVEDIVKSNIQLEWQDNYEIDFVAYTRIDKKQDTYSGNKHIKDTYIVSAKDWDSLVYVHKYLTGEDEAGYANVLRDIKTCTQNLYIPIIDFVADMKIEKADLNFFLKPYQKNSLYIFNSGNSYHGVLDKLMSGKEYMDWLKLLKTSDLVDQKWLNLAICNAHGNSCQILRTTWSKHRPEPKFLKQVFYTEKKKSKLSQLLGF